MGLFTDVVLAFWYIIEALLQLILPSVFLRKKYTLVNKNVLVTGAASGIGRQIALQIAARNNLVILVDINEQQLKEFADEIKSMGHKCHYQVCDVSKKDEIAKAAKLIKAAVGEVDVLINNAGVAVMRPLLDHSDAEIERTLQINLHAHFWTIRAFLPDMIARRSGHIVSISSIAGIIGTPNLTAYCASKFGVVGLHESVRLEIDLANLSDKIGMTLVGPFYVKTRLLQGARAGRFDCLLPLTEPEDLAKKILRSIEYRQELLLVPWLLYLLMMAKGLLPIKASIQLLKLFAIDEGMKNAQASTLTFLPNEKK